MPHRPFTSSDRDRRRGRAGRTFTVAILVSAGLIVAAVLIVMAQFEAPEQRTRGELDEEDFVDLIPDDDPRAFDETSSDPREDVGVELARGGWVEITNEQGRLVQRYQAERLDPLPNLRLEMHQPRALLYLKDNRVISLRGARAIATRGTGNRLESGTMTGNVVIQLFSGTEKRPVDIARDKPDVIVRTEEATFDQARGDVRCDGLVSIETESLDNFHGRGLSVIFEENAGLQRLVVEEAEPDIRIALAALGADEDREDNVSSAETGARSTETAPSQMSEADGSADRALADAGRDDPTADTAPPADQSRGQTGQGSPPERPDSAQPPAFYRATFHDNVRITTGRKGEQQIVTGDEMRIVFSMDNSDLGESLAQAMTLPAFGRPRSHRAAAHHGTAMTYLAGLAIALPAPSFQATDDNPSAIAAPPRDDDLYLSFTGRLVIVPTTQSEDQLATADDVRLELFGEPVTIVDQEKDARIACAAMRYTASNEIVTLDGNDTSPLAIESPQLDAEGTSFVYNTAQGGAQFIGPGMMTVRPESSQSLLGSSNGTQSSDLVARERAAQNPGDSAGPLTIHWSHGVDLSFAERTDQVAQHDDTQPERAPISPAASTGWLQRAVFNGDVVVRYTADDSQFLMETDDSLIAGFIEAPGSGDQTAQGEQLDFIETTGPVVVRGLDERDSSLSGDSLRLDFERNPDPALDKMSPRTLLVRGNAEARNIEERISADTLDVTLIERVQAEQDQPAGVNAPDESREPESSRTVVDIEHLIARDDVTIVMKNGTTATGDLLTADATQNSAELTGRVVRISRPYGEDGQSFVTLGTNARIDRIQDDFIITMKGSGTFDGEFASRGERNPDSSGAPEDTDAPRETVHVEWQESFIYEEHGQNATVHLFGTVHAESEPSPFERNTIDGEKIVLHLKKIAQTGSDEAGDISDESDAARATEDDVFQGRFQLQSLDAYGAPAKLENRSWPKLNHQGTPKINYVEGKLVKYNAITRSSEVVGEGAVLVQDMSIEGPAPGRDTSETDPSESSEEDAAGTPDESGVFAGISDRGRSLFTWTDRMQTIEIADGRHQIDMHGNVQMIHQPLEGEPSTMLTGSMRVIVQRSRAAQEDLGGLDFGGEAKLLRFEGKEGIVDGQLRRVQMNSQRKEIIASEVQYDYETGIAYIFGTQSRPAMVRPEPGASFMHATGFIWNITDGTLRIEDVRATVPR